MFQGSRQHFDPLLSNAKKSEHELIFQNQRTPNKGACSIIRSELVRQLLEDYEV